MVTGLDPRDKAREPRNTWLRTPIRYCDPATAAKVKIPGGLIDGELGLELWQRLSAGEALTGSMSARLMDHEGRPYPP